MNTTRTIQITEDGSLEPQPVEAAIEAMRGHECFDLDLGVLRTERLIMCVADAGVKRMICNVMFARDSSYMVDLCYFESSDGLATATTIRTEGGKGVIDVGPEAKVTSNHLKFTHHASGLCNFSKTGKVESIRSWGLPLAEDIGHVFTIRARGARHFKRLKARYEGKPPTTSRAVVSFSAMLGKPGEVPLAKPEVPVESVRITGWWHNARDLQAKLVKRGVHPALSSAALRGDHGERYMATRLAPPRGQRHDDHCLMLLVEAMSHEDPGGRSLEFFGGFSHRQGDMRGDTGVLALAYPIENIAELRKRLGTIDIQGRSRES